MLKRHGDFQATSRQWAAPKAQQFLRRGVLSGLVGIARSPLSSWLRAQKSLRSSFFIFERCCVNREIWHVFTALLYPSRGHKRGKLGELLPQ